MPTKEDYHRAYVAAVNHIEPTHSHYDGTHKRIHNAEGPRSMWPMKLSELETSYNKSTSSTWATSGPRSYGKEKAFLSIDHSYFERQSRERCAAIIVHEITHISIGSFTTVQGGSHPPRFWERFCDYALEIADELDILAECIGGPIYREGFLREVCEDPNGSMVDRRYETVAERKEEMRRAVGLVESDDTDNPLTAEIESIQAAASDAVADSE